jgi:4-alpha-glucanotransferase
MSIDTRTGRHAGVLVPLFSIPSTLSWGIGEIADIAPLAAWLRSARLDILQVLPLNEMSVCDCSPYSALSAMAIDRIYISVHALEDFVEPGGEAAMDRDWRDRLATARSRSTIDYPLVRTLKDEALSLAFERFRAKEWDKGTPRAAELAAWIETERHWLDDYALFRALHSRYHEESWVAWPFALRRRFEGALEAARAGMAHQIQFLQYLQWVAAGQWRAARRDASGVTIFGDLPFMVDLDSADVWARQDQFNLDASVGAPPDAFSPSGQDWGFPACRWDVMKRDGYAWFKDRARRGAALYDGFRLDHLVGLYRTYTVPRDGSPRFFNPPEPDDQLELGETLVEIFAGTPAHLIAEDLGTVPDFVRASLGRLGVPGYRVLRWEREWDEAGRPFRDPSTYPAASVATTGTHDTETLAVWWDQLPGEERDRVGRIRELRRILGRGFDFAGAAFSPRLRDGLLQTLFVSGSDLLILPIQDVFGWRERINLPGSLSEDNWSWRLRWPTDLLASSPEARERARTLRRWVARRVGTDIPASGFRLQASDQS